MPREQYVRPPLVARELGNPQAAVWRVRVVGIVLAIVTLIGLTWVMLRATHVANGEDPGLGGLHSPSGTLSSALVPFGSTGSSSS